MLKKQCPHCKKKVVNSEMRDIYIVYWVSEQRSYVKEERLCSKCMTLLKEKIDKFLPGKWRIET